MFERLEQIGVGAGEFIRAEGGLLLARARRSLFWSGVIGLGVLAIIAGMLGLLVALGVLLSMFMHWGWALTIVAAMVLIAGGVALAVAARRARHDLERVNLPLELQVQSRKARERIAGVSSEPPPSAQIPTSEPESPSLQDRIVGIIANHPAIAAGGAVLTLAAVGPGRAIKLAGRGLLIASIADKIREQLDRQHRAPHATSNGVPRSPHAAAPPPSPRTHEATGTHPSSREA